MICVAVTGNDSNDGLTWATAKATIAGGLAALGSVAGVISVGPGTFTISAPDTYGNGVTLASTGIILEGESPVSTTVVVNCSATWGIEAMAPGCKVRNLAVQCGPAGFVTYGAGVDTPAANGTAELCVFENVNVTQGSGTMINGLCAGPTWTGSNTPDVAETYFFHCRSVLVSNAAYYIGNGTVSQILNTYMIGCFASRSRYGLYVNATNVNWLSGTIQKNAYDIYFNGPLSSAASRISGVRSENSQRLLGCSPNSTGSGQLTLEDITWQSWGGMFAGYPAAAGDFIQWGHCGTLNLSNLTINTGFASPYNITPVISVTPPNSTHKALAVNISGFQAATTLARLLSSSNPYATANVAGFVALDPVSNAPLVNTPPASPVNLVSSMNPAVINGVTYFPMS